MFVLYIDYYSKYNKELNSVKLKSRNAVAAGREATEIISDQFWSQELREMIYCFTLEDSKGNVIGRFRPYHRNGNITFGFHFE